MLFGVHTSVAGGYPQAIEYALSVGCECMQIFAKSPRQWFGKPTDPDVAAAFVETRARTGMGPVFTHTAYLINLTTTNEELREKSIRALADELARGAMLGADGVVTHTGTDPDADADAAAYRLGCAVAEAFELTGGVGECDTRLLLENTAGGGTTYGCEWSQLGRAIAESGLGVDRIGVCLDTCHAFAFGYPLNTADGWASMVAELDEHVGVERLGLVHANDCKFELGSRRDRHAWIGDGYIGYEGFRAMVCVPALAQVPACCEMPGEVPEKDAVNVERLKALRAECDE